MATPSTTTSEPSSLAILEQSRREKLARMAERFDEVDRRLAELEARLEKAEEEFRPKQPR
jgi:ubiquinone biosynthesis protein UbiJ